MGSALGESGAGASRRRRSARPCRSSSVPRRSRSKRTTPCRSGEALGDGVLVQPGEDALDRGRPDLVARHQREEVVVGRSRASRPPASSAPTSAKKAAPRRRRRSPERWTAGPYRRPHRRGQRPRSCSPTTVREVGARSHPRAAPRAVPPARPWTSALDPAAVGAPRLEELPQLVVVERRAGQGPADVLGDVVVAELHRVGVAEGARTAPRRWSTPRCPGRVRSRRSASSCGRPRCARGRRRPARPAPGCASGPGRRASAATPTTGSCAAVSGAGWTHSRSAGPGPGCALAVPVDERSGSPRTPPGRSPSAR